jgi:hypothetical protein
MPRVVLAFGIFLTMGFSVVAALTLPPAGSSPGDQSLIHEVQGRCPPGQYFCPGKIAGCCPKGWGCGSTKCIAPRREPVRYGNCYWDGTRPFCAGSCRSGFVVRQREGSGCISGSRVYCCERMGSTSQY